MTMLLIPLEEQGTCCTSEMKGFQNWLRTLNTKVISAYKLSFVTLEIMEGELASFS